MLEYKPREFLAGISLIHGPLLDRVFLGIEVANLLSAAHQCSAEKAR